MAKGQGDGWPRAGRGYEGLLRGEATCKEEMKSRSGEDGLYKGKSGPWRGRRMAYPLTTLCLLVNPTGLDYCKEEMKSRSGEDGLYKGKSGPWRGRRMAYPLTTLCLLVNPTGLDYCI